MQISLMEVGSADLVFLCFVCFWREKTATVFALKRTSLGEGEFARV